MWVVMGCGRRRGDADSIEAPHDPIASSSATTQVSPVDALHAAIESAIAMLEKKSYREFLERFVAPADRKKLFADGGIEKILPDFARDKAQPLLEMLRSIRDGKPRMEGADAVFDTKDKEMHWVLDGGEWYIRN